LFAMMRFKHGPFRSALLPEEKVFLGLFDKLPA
jgi:hypothetical protein